MLSSLAWNRIEKDCWFSGAEKCGSREESIWIRIAPALDASRLLGILGYGDWSAPRQARNMILSLLGLLSTCSVYNRTVPSSRIRIFLLPIYTIPERKKERKKRFQHYLQNQRFQYSFLLLLSKSVIYLDDVGCVTNDVFDEFLFGSGTKSWRVCKERVLIVISSDVEKINSFWDHSSRLCIS